MFGIIALNQICKINLGWNEFCHCYVVKQNCAGTYYFSHRETTTVLVTDLPKSEKGWKDNLISLTGDWERRPGDTVAHWVPRIKAAPTHKSTGLKPRDSDVNHLDLNKALSLPNEERNWKQLRDHLHPESKIADESQTSLLTATCPPHNSLGSYAQSMEADPSEMMTDILSSPSTYKKQKRIHPHSATPIVANVVLTNPCSDYESTPSVAAVKSKGTIGNINLEGSKDQETANLSKEEIKIDKSFEEALSQFDQTYGKFQKEFQGIMHRFFSNEIKKLKAIIARKDEEIEELMSVKKEPVTAGIPGATNTESLNKAREETKENPMFKFAEHLKGHFDEFFQKFSAMAKLQEAQQPQPQLSCRKLSDDLAYIIAKDKEPQRPRFHTWIDSSSSGNNEPLPRQNQNDHTEGAAAATLRQNQNVHTEGAAAGTLLPNVSLQLCTRPPNDQNVYLGNHHYQGQQITEPSLNYYNLPYPTATMFPCLSDPFDHTNPNFGFENWNPNS